MRPESESLLRSICNRERVSMAVIGRIRLEGTLGTLPQPFEWSSAVEAVTKMTYVALHVWIILKCSGDGRIVLVDDLARNEARSKGLPDPMPAVDLDLEKVSLLCGFKFVHS